MSYQMQPETVRKVRIQIGDEWQEVDFGREVPHKEAMARAWVMLATFDRDFQS